MTYQMHQVTEAINNGEPEDLIAEMRYEAQMEAYREAMGE